MRMHPIQRLRLAVCCLPWLVLVGCNDESPPVKSTSIEGTVEAIDLEYSQVTLRYFLEKHKKERTDTGEVTNETEIWINGELSSLKDLRVGERVNAVVRYTGSGDDLRITAMKIRVQRSEPIKRPAAPAQQPQSEGSDTQSSPPS